MIPGVSGRSSTKVYAVGPPGTRIKQPNSIVPREGEAHVKESCSVALPCHPAGTLQTLFTSLPSTAGIPREVKYIQEEEEDGGRKREEDLQDSVREFVQIVCIKKYAQQGTNKSSNQPAIHLSEENHDESRALESDHLSSRAWDWFLETMETSRWR
ncbi:hypothetical protein M0804_011804 [Polistes exclamans]|nr:hypothetical protein M0804_011804 [Polistes exclamans]